MSLSETAICNMALARIGAQRINDLDTDANVQAIQCRLFYEPDRDALQRMYWWPFCSARAELAIDVTAPTFEYDYSFSLPADCLELRTIWDENTTGGNLSYTCALEGNHILTDESAISIRYTKKVTDPAEFDPLFIQVLKTRLALDMLYPLCGASAVGAADRLMAELEGLMVRVKLINLAEQNLTGRAERRAWIDVRWNNASADPAHLGGN